MERPTLLAAAFSARQIARSGRRAGFDVLAVDFFGDLDLAEAAARSEVLRGHYPDGFANGDLLAALDRLASGEAPAGFVYGAGFEDRPELLEEIGRRWPILGADAATVRRLKDPEAFAALCREAGVAHPDIRREEPSDPENWLSKQCGGCGGSHVREAAGQPADPHRYYQRRVAGERWSALFVAAGGEAAVLGFTVQWPDPSPSEPYRYGGAVGPLEPPQDADAAMAQAVARIAALCPLTGLGSADFIVGDDGPVLLEINPRCGATIDTYEAIEPPLLAMHVEACRGRLPASWRLPAGKRAAGLAWASAPGAIPAGFVWPDWTRDRTSPPTMFAAGEPICTVVADADTREQAEALFRARAAEMVMDLGRKAA